MKNWDKNKREFVETSEEIRHFFEEIESVCKKHGFSISHEDGHGAFEIEKYDKKNIDWLKDANINIK